MKSTKSETAGETEQNHDHHSQEITPDKVDINENKDGSQTQCTQEKSGDAFRNGNKSNSLFKSNSETAKNSSIKETEEIPEKSQPEVKKIPGSQDKIVVNDKNGEKTAARSPGEALAPETSEAGGESTQHSTNIDSPDVPTSGEKKSVTCNICGETFLTMIEHNLHKKQCFPAPDFLSSGMEDVIEAEYRARGKGEANAEETPQFLCSLCDQKFTNLVWLTKHTNNCQVGDGERNKEEKEQTVKPNDKEVKIKKSECIPKESEKNKSPDISKKDPLKSTDQIISKKDPQILKDQDMSKQDPLKSKEPDISKKDPQKSKEPDISNPDPLKCKSPGISKKDPDIKVPQISKSPDISNPDPLLSKSKSVVNTERKTEPELDIPKEEVITRNSVAGTNEKSDEVKNVNKKSEKIVKNSAPTPIKPGGDNSTGKETNKKETSQVDLPSVNPINEVKTKKQIKSRAEKCPETEIKKMQISGSVDKDSSENRPLDTTKNSGKLRHHNSYFT